MTPQNVPEELEEQIRSIRYTFPLAFFEMKTIRTSLVFSVGDKPMPNFRMIERHYFRDQLQRSYDFTFGFCIPGSTNSWEVCAFGRREQPAQHGSGAWRREGGGGGGYYSSGI